MGTTALATALVTPTARTGGSVARVTPVTPIAPRRRRIAGTSAEPLTVHGCADLGAAGLGTAERRSGEEGRSLAQRQAAARRIDIEPSALRLTGRGRAVLTAISILVFGAAVVVLGLRVAGVLTPEPQFTRTVQVEVGAGDSLWSIAQRTNPTDSPAAVVDRIAELNGLRTSADLLPGRTLLVPTN